MKLHIIIKASLFTLLALTFNANAHSGRTDVNGGHNCSQKSKDKGLCSGYHYHGTTKHTHAKKAEKATAKSN
ncbi:YHYH domain-containing protein [Thalassotalea litorea]|uniref:YHYH domain-containing protein n=1 Tax=Thalassotalea litorea TaxID=2020715 RepID=A0A5R9IC94_9GAMM|nr:YHYH domain-containing protein [Thalassotalea litorea]TLU61216.1 YHYH domain-containing protein [Thalassotalea litorea]